MTKETVHPPIELDSMDRVRPAPVYAWGNCPGCNCRVRFEPGQSWSFHCTQCESASLTKQEKYGARILWGVAGVTCVALVTAIYYAVKHFVE